MNTLTSKQVRDIRKEQAARYSGRDLELAVRVEIHAALQLSNPPPYSDFPSHIEANRRAPLSHEERAEVQMHQRAQVTDEEHLAFAKLRAQHPYLLDGHHYAQWRHGQALWAEADRLLATGGA